MKSIYQKLKDWYRGKFIPLSTEEMINLVRQSRRHHENQELSMPNRFKRPLIARIVNYIWHFWLRHWKWIIGTIIAVISLKLFS